jgi:hypothetical protein
MFSFFKELWELFFPEVVLSHEPEEEWIDEYSKDYR